MSSEFIPDGESKSTGEVDAALRRSQQRAAGGSDPGCERLTNQDRYLLLQSPLGAGYFVFDGMGGEPDGEAAAQVSSEAIQEFFCNQAGSDPREALCAAIEIAQYRLLSARTSSYRSGMGTTVVAACVTKERVAIASVGDSRAYRVGGSSIEQLSSDHTIVQQLVDAGQLNAQEALVHPQSHVLTRCLGSAISFKVDCRSFFIQEISSTEDAESLVLCSDGLYSMVADSEIAEVVSRMPAEAAVEHLIRLARERGGFDNITVVVVPLAGRLGEEAQGTSEKPVPVSSSQRAEGTWNRTLAGRIGDAHVKESRDFERGSQTSLGGHIKNSLILSIVASAMIALFFTLLTMLQR